MIDIIDMIRMIFRYMIRMICGNDAKSYSTWTQCYDHNCNKTYTTDHKTHYYK